MPIPNPTWGCQERKRVHDPESYEVFAFKSQGHNPEGANAAVWNCQECIGMAHGSKSDSWHPIVWEDQ